MYNYISEVFMQKAIFIDVDGTLRNDNAEVTGRTINALKMAKENGYEPILCTGRPKDYAERLNNSISGSNYIIYNNGAGICDSKNNIVIYENKMTKDSILELYKIANKDNVRFMLSGNGTKYVNVIKYTDGTETLIEWPLETFLDKINIIAVTIASSDFDTIKDMIEHVNKIPGIKIMNKHKSLADDSYEKVGTIYIDVVEENTSKGNAVKHFCEIYNIPIENRIAIGDDNNDLYMFEQCGYKVAMGNALKPVKEIADYITDDNNNDGVAKFIEKLIEEK
jgi:Cof subfamily protein (haloacid dehalogenase superfamily)